MRWRDYEQCVRVRTRREFISSAVGFAVLGPQIARAQQPARSRRIAIVAPARPVEEIGTANPFFNAFLQELGRLGFEEGQNLIVDRYSAGGLPISSYPDLARQVVRNKPDAIQTTALPMSRAMSAATATIPIVVLIGDPVVAGLAESLARPGGNVTGVTVDAGVELFGKRLDLLREVRRDASRVAYLASSTVWEQHPQSAMVREAAGKSGLTITHVDLGDHLNEAAYTSAFRLVSWTEADVLLVSDEPYHLVHSKTLVELVTNARVPACYPFRDLVSAGGLMAYYRDLADAGRQLAAQMAQILSGAKPAHIPFQQPTHFRLSINAKAAQKIGVVLPPTLLVSADEVIE